MLALRIAKLPKIIKPDWKSWVAKSEILRSRRSPQNDHCKKYSKS